MKGTAAFSALTRMNPHRQALCSMFSRDVLFDFSPVDERRHCLTLHNPGKVVRNPDSDKTRLHAHRHGVQIVFNSRAMSVVGDPSDIVKYIKAVRR